MTELILIRHGETDWNAQQRIQGHLDVPLNRNGLSQADAIGQRFRSQSVDKLVSSDLARAMQTAEPIAKACGLEIVEDARLRERHLGILQGKTREQAQQQVPDAFDVFRSRIAAAPLEDGESLEVFARRVIDALTDLARLHNGKRVVAVTHGGVVDIAHRHANDIALDAPRMSPILNTSVNTLRITNKRFELVDWGDTRHLSDRQAIDEF